MTRAGGEIGAYQGVSNKGCQPCESTQIPLSGGFYSVTPTLEQFRFKADQRDICKP